MNAKDQAKAIVNEFYFALPNNGYLNIGKNNCSQRWTEAIKCALICVDRLIKAFDYLVTDFGEDYYTTHTYWLDVKKEIKLIELEDGKGN